MQKNTDVVMIMLAKQLTQDTEKDVKERLEQRLNDVNDMNTPDSKIALARCRYYLKLDQRIMLKFHQDVLVTMQKCQWLRDMINIMKTNSVLNYFLYSRLLDHLDFPAHVVNYEFYNSKVDVFDHVHLTPRDPPEYDDDQVWTSDELDVDIIVNRNDDVGNSNNFVNFAVTLNDDGKEANKYKILNILCNTFEVFTELTYESFDANYVSTKSTLQIELSFISSACKIRYMLTGSCNVGLDNQWESRNDGTLRMQGKPECKWTELVLIDFRDYGNIH